MLRSALVLCLAFIEEVLQTLNPIRNAGELVALDDAGWVLERLLGIDHCGEIWLGIKTEHRGSAVRFTSELRVFRFFTKDLPRRKILASQRDLTSTLATLGNHPHIVLFHHLAVYEEKFPYTAMEYVSGGSLDDWIVEKPEQRVPLRKHEIMAGIISALAEAHDGGVFHRDLNPRKVLLSDRFEPEERNKKPRVYDVQAKIADFGLSNITAGVPLEIVPEAASGPGAPASAPWCACMSQYLPPEADHVRERSPAQDDLFALGVIWYQLLAEAMERPPYNFADSAWRSRY